MWVHAIYSRIHRNTLMLKTYKTANMNYYFPLLVKCVAALYYCYLLSLFHNGYYSKPICPNSWLIFKFNFIANLQDNNKYYCIWNHNFSRRTANINYSFFLLVKCVTALQYDCYLLSLFHDVHYSKSLRPKSQLLFKSSFNANLQQYNNKYHFAPNVYVGLLTLS